MRSIGRVIRCVDGIVTNAERRGIMSEAAGSTGTEAPLDGKDGPQGEDGGWKPPSDGSWLPKVRVDEMVNTARGEAATQAAEAARLRAENETLKAAKAQAEAPKPVSRAELKQLVEDGKITQDAADAHWEKQVLDAAEKRGREAARGEVEGQQRELTVNNQLAEFKTLVPAAWATGSKERAKAEKEFSALRAMGFPDNKVTEVAALRAAFGDPEVIRASRSTGRNGPGETFDEVGGGDRGESGGEQADGKPKGLDARQEAHYTKLIQRGVYKDWKAVAEELKPAKAKQA